MNNYTKPTGESGETKRCIFGAKYIHARRNQTLAVPECRDRNMMAMNLSNRVHITMPDMQKRLLMPYSLVVLPKGSAVEIECTSETEMLLLFFDCLDPDLNRAMYEFRNTRQDYFVTDSFPRMKMDQALKSFATIIIDVYVDFLDDPVFLSNKFPELAFILIKMHPVEEVYALLSPLFCEVDPEFRSKVINSYQPSANVKTLANSCGYSLSLFTQKFKSSFGVPPGEWIKDKQKDRIMYLLTKSSLSLQSIADDLGMSSQQQLTRYCKREFGCTPKEITAKKE